LPSSRPACRHTLSQLSAALLHFHHPGGQFSLATTITGHTVIDRIRTVQGVTDTLSTILLSTKLDRPE